MINKTHADDWEDHQFVDFTHIITLLTGDILDILHKVETVGRDTQPSFKFSFFFRKPNS